MAVWCTEEMVAGFEKLEQAGILSVSDYMRDAMVSYLLARGIDARVARPLGVNGEQQAAE